MAGIAGIISRNSMLTSSTLQSAFEKMLDALGITTNQEKKTIHYGNCFMGNVISESKKVNDNYMFNIELGIYCVFEGLIYVDDSEKIIIQKNYFLSSTLSDNEYIPYLYSYYKADYIKHLSGWFNIFLYDVKNETCVLSNDRLGLLPLYYYESDSIFIFASKIESLLASDLISKIEFDFISMTEHLLFNYPLMSHTFIKNISTLPTAIQYTFTDSVTKSVYWSPYELISSAPLSRKKSIDLIDETLKQVIDKPFSKDNYPVCATLTGGWDGRLILAYMLPEYRERLNAFSFGSETSHDVLIPAEIASKENFNYNSFFLNQNYINKSFIDSAEKTILLSNGLRSYRRSHYIYAAQHLASTADMFISGNFGDEVFKFAQVLPSEIISKNLISLIQSEFRLRTELLKNENSQMPFFLNNPEIKEELYARLDELEKEVAIYSSLSEKFQHLKFTRIATKYFGTEINSYNDYISNFSPFLDFDFLSVFTKTCYAGIYYPFNGNKLKHKEMTSMLYAELIKRNSKSLLYYKTDRGYNLADMMSPLGKLAVLYKKKFNRNNPIKDPYFLNQADTLFSKALKYEINGTLNMDLLFKSDDILVRQKDKLVSLGFWMNHISNKYIK